MPNEAKKGNTYPYEYISDDKLSWSSFQCFWHSTAIVPQLTLNAEIQSSLSDNLVAGLSHGPKESLLEGVGFYPQRAVGKPASTCPTLDKPLPEPRRSTAV